MRSESGVREEKNIAAAIVANSVKTASTAGATIFSEARFCQTTHHETPAIARLINALIQKTVCVFSVDLLS